MKKHLFLTDAQLQAEIEKCEFCEEKPCKEACPVDCSPADFIMAAKLGTPVDYQRAASVIFGSNPLGGVCGAVCPDYHCMKACVHRTFNEPVKIPAVQATIIQKAKDLNKVPAFRIPEPNGMRVAIIGTGPAGLGVGAYLAQKGYEIHFYERDKKPGGMCNLIPDYRLNKKVLATDLEFMKSLGHFEFYYGNDITDFKSFLKTKRYDALAVCAGLDRPFRLGIPGEDRAVMWDAFLKNPKKHPLTNKRVAVIGGGAIAVDCAVTAVNRGAATVEMICLEVPAEMPLTGEERKTLFEHPIAITGRTRAASIAVKGRSVTGVYLKKVILPKGKPFHPRHVVDDKKSQETYRPFDAVIYAIGSRPSVQTEKIKGVFYSGDLVNGPTTVVEAVAAGKNTGAVIDAYLQGTKIPKFKKPTKSRLALAGRMDYPVSLETDFFGRPIISPFLLSAAPPSDGYEQMKKAYEAGWAGGVMKTTFDNVPIHIPGEYMFAFTRSTYANCDNVSGHPMDRVCKEVEKLIREFPDRLTVVSTGGPVTGHDETDKHGWQSNTKKLENAGVMGIEYSLSCPQGGDGTKGDIVSQDAELTAKIIDWVMEISDPNIPKLFKLTAAVTAIYPILSAIQEVFNKYPNKKAGVTLANTFPTLAFRKGAKKQWEEGIVVGMSGEGVIPISNLTLANASRFNMIISGNGGPMDYKAAANFLALGVTTVQFCTIVMKYGYGIIEHLDSGLSYLMAERGFRSVKDMIGCALPNPITGFMELSAIKKISDVNKDLCEHCGNCTRCPYLAIELNKNKVPFTDPSKCIGCSICVQKCFAGALFMRDRTPEETALLREH